MNHQETLKLVAFVHAVCPHQQLDEATPEAWKLVLDRVPYADAQTAAVTIAGRERYVEPSAIIAEVKRIRAARLAQFDPETLIPPAGLSVLEDVAWRRRQLAAVAEGRPVEENTRGELKPRDWRAALTRGPDLT